MDTRMITGDTVRTALRAVRFAKPLGDSPLLTLDALDAWMAGQAEASSHSRREWGLGQFLAEVICQQLGRLRSDDGTARRPTLTPEAELALLRRDFQAGRTELEAWSLLYHRYLATDRTPVGEVAELLGLTDKTLERRLNRGHELLAVRLRQLEGQAALLVPSIVRLSAAGAGQSSAGGSDQSTDAAPPPSPPLPLPLTAFVGRAVDVDALQRLVRDQRVVTLTGPGGIGKTRLALEVGRTMADRWPGGVWLVELAAVAEGAQVVRALAQALGVQEHPGRPLADDVAENLQEGERLLILDNCEHVREACAVVVAALVARCRALHILTTSREPLHLVGEQLWPVAPLGLPAGDATPDLASVADCEAVALFAARAREAQPGFALSAANAATVARICARLDGIPLALELAAARVRALDVAEIDRRLDQRFRLLTRGAGTTAARHQTLKAAIDWGYELLGEPERVLLRRLSVFRGGWTVEAAEAVCSDEALDPLDVLDGLTALVDKSFVMPGRAGEGGRFRLLETIRAYAGDRLIASGQEEPVRRRHLAWCTALAEAADAELQGAGQAMWMDRLDAERDNLRAALAWGADRGVGDDLGLGLGAALGRYWVMRGFLTEGREQLGRLLATHSTQPGAARAKAFAAAGKLAQQQCDYAEAIRWFEESLAIERKVKNEAGVAEILRDMGRVADEQGDQDRARSLYEESLALYRTLGNRWGTAAALNNLGILNYHLGACEVARPFLEESLAIFRDLDDRWAVGATLFNLGHVYLDEGDLANARASYSQSQDIAREMKDQTGIVSALGGLGNVARREGDHAAARRLYLESIEGLVEVDDKQDIAECLESLAIIDRAEGDSVAAVHRIAAADALREAIGAPVTQKSRAEWEAQVAALRESLGEGEFAARWAEGRGMGWREAAG